MTENRLDSWPMDGWELLSPLLTNDRREKIFNTAQERTEHVRLIIQDVHDPHNISACLRSAEAFGVLNVDVIDQKAKYKPSKAAKGSFHWLEVHHWNSIEKCAQNLKDKGYQIAAGFPPPEGRSLYDTPTEEPIALLFGNEHEGVSSEWLPWIDHKFTIPMVGMVESLNISVSAAISMAHMTRSSKLSNPDNYRLNPLTQKHLLSKWGCRHFRNPHQQIEVLRQRSSSHP